MAKPNQATRAKRDRERNRQEHQHEKQEKKALQRTEQKKQRDRLLAEGQDPDLAGIVPGPQASESEADL